MNTTQKTIPSPEGRRQLDTLHQAVGKTLERKRRLGQYAVIWQDGKAVAILVGDTPTQSLDNKRNAIT